jgi:hypothetical protein
VVLYSNDSATRHFLGCMLNFMLDAPFRFGIIPDLTSHTGRTTRILSKFDSLCEWLTLGNGLRPLGSGVHVESIV